MRFARRRLQRRGILDEELAQDLAGEALVRYFDPAYASFNSERHESVAYFLGSTVNGLLRNYFKRLNRRGERFVEDLPIDIQERSIPAHQLGRLEGEETLARLRSLLEGDDELLAIFDLKLQGFSTPQEQAEASDLSRKQIYAATRRAERRFRIGGVLPTKNATREKDKEMSTAPPVTELLDACSRWGIDGAAEEYGVTTAQVCAWMREHPEELPESIDLDAPVVWPGKSIIQTAPSMRTLWRWSTRIEGGDSISRIAKEHGLTHESAKRYLALFEEHVASSKPRESPEELTDKEEEVADKETTEEVDRHAWNIVSVLASQPDAPAIATIATRAESDDPKWAHYESIPAKEVEGNWHPRTTTLYRLREGTGWKELEVDLQTTQPSDERVCGSLKGVALRYEAEAERWKHRAEAAEATLASIQEALEPIGDFAGKDTPIDQRIAQLAERSFREHANLYAMQQAALEFMEKYDVSDDGWWDSDLVDYVNAACQGIEDHYNKQFAGVEDMREALLAVHRECERQGYGADDKRAAVEKVHDIIDYTEEVVQLAARQGQQIKELESKLELTPERHDLGLIVEDWERIKELLHHGGHPAAGSCLSPTIETLLEHSAELQDLSRLKAAEPSEEGAGSTIAQRLDRLADLENELANFYALRATEDFADPDDRCWDLEQATKHVRRWQEVVEEQDIEAGR